MRKLSNPLLYILRSNIKLQLNTKNIESVQNRIFCSQEYTRASVAAMFVKQEMSEYPIRQRRSRLPLSQYNKNQESSLGKKSKGILLSKYTKEVALSAQYPTVEEIKNILQTINKQEIREVHQYLDILSKTLVQALKNQKLQNFVQESIRQTQGLIGQLKRRKKQQ